MEDFNKTIKGLMKDIDNMPQKVTIEFTLPLEQAVEVIKFVEKLAQSKELV